MKKFLNLEFLTAVLATLLGITYFSTNDYLLGVLWCLVGGLDWWDWFNKNWWRFRWTKIVS